MITIKLGNDSFELCNLESFLVDEYLTSVLQRAIGIAQLAAAEVDDVKTVMFSYNYSTAEMYDIIRLSCDKEPTFEQFKKLSLEDGTAIKKKLQTIIVERDMLSRCLPMQKMRISQALKVLEAMHQQ